MKKCIILALSLGVLSLSSVSQADKLWSKMGKFGKDSKKWTCIIDNIHIDEVYEATNSDRSKAKAKVKQRCSDGEEDTFWCTNPKCKKAKRH